MNMFKKVTRKLTEWVKEYQWHDLEKYPNELPSLNSRVFIGCELGGKIYYSTAKYTEKGFEDGVNPPSVTNYYTVSWRYIIKCKNN